MTRFMQYNLCSLSHIMCITVRPICSFARSLNYSTLSVRPSQSSPSCSVLSLACKFSTLFCLVHSHLKMSTVSPSHDPSQVVHLIISSASLSQLAQEDKVTSSSVVTGGSHSTKMVGIVTAKQAVKPVQVGDSIVPSLRLCLYLWCTSILGGLGATRF